MKEPEWVVQCFGDIDTPGKGFELSVVRSGNTHGRRSWGWGCEDKIVLFSTGTGCNQLNPGRPDQVAFAKKAAELLCAALNLDEAT